MLDYRFETFMVLCKTLNYSECAKQMHLSQPAITKQIQHLESTYNFKLFNYKGKTLTLTNQGQKLYEKLLVLYGVTRSTISELVNVENDDFYNFCCTYTVGEYILPEIIDKFIDENPYSKFKLEILGTRQCLNFVEQQNVQFAIVEGVINKSLYQYELLKYTEMILVVPKGHQLTTRENTGIKDVVHYPLIIRRKEEVGRGILPTALSQHNYSYESFVKIIEAGSMNNMKYLTIHNKGICFLHREIVEKELKAEELIEIPLKNFKLEREINIVSLAQSTPNDSASKLLEYIKKHIN